jgi:hypothetical protein
MSPNSIWLSYSSRRSSYTSMPQAPRRAYERELGAVEVEDAAAVDQVP